MCVPLWWDFPLESLRLFQIEISAMPFPLGASAHTQGIPLEPSGRLCGTLLRTQDYLKVAYLEFLVLLRDLDL